MSTEKAKSIEKELPYSIEAEQAVLGSLTIDPDALALVADFLKPDDFYREAHRLIYTAILTLSEQLVPADFITLSDELERTNKLEEVGGDSYICELANMVPTSGHVEHYGRIVARKALNRRLIGLVGEIAGLAYDEENDVIEKAEEGLYSLALPDSSSCTSDEDIMAACFPKLRSASGSLDDIIGLRTGFYELDGLIGGLQPSTLVVLASRPGVGKTSLCLNIASNVAYQQKKCVGVFSLEMSKEELGMRLIAMHSGVDQQRLIQRAIREEEYGGLVEAMEMISQRRLFIDDTGDLSLTALKSRARRMRVERGVDLIIIDYLQLLHATCDGKRFMNREQEIAEISRGLKALAKELDIPILSLAQLSRAVEQRQSKIPQLSDLRESGAIENDSDIVLFIYRKELYDVVSPEDRNTAEIHVAKHRNGPLGSVRLRFIARQTLFQNPDDEVEQAS